MVDQKITQRATIAAGQTGYITVPINVGESAKLLGYGYVHVPDSTYRLFAGSTVFPKRTDQIGTVTTPYMFINPPIVNSGKDIRVLIENNSSSSHTYTVTFIIEATRIINIESASGGSTDTVNTLLCIPEYESSVLLPSGEVDTSYVLNKKLVYLSLDIPEGIVLELLNDGTRLIKSTDEIGALEFTSGLDIGTLRVLVENISSVSLRWYLKLIFEES